MSQWNERCPDTKQDAYLSAYLPKTTDIRLALNQTIEAQHVGDGCAGRLPFSVELFMLRSRQFGVGTLRSKVVHLNATGEVFRPFSKLLRHLAPRQGLNLY